MASRLEVLLACANGDLALPELSVLEMDSLEYRSTCEIGLKPCKMKSIVGGRCSSRSVKSFPCSRVFPAHTQARVIGMLCFSSCKLCS